MDLLCVVFCLKIDSASRRANRAKVFIFISFVCINFVCTFYTEILDIKIDLELPSGLALLKHVKLHHAVYFEK